MNAAAHTLYIAHSHSASGVALILPQFTGNQATVSACICKNISYSRPAMAFSCVFTVSRKHPEYTFYTHFFLTRFFGGCSILKRLSLRLVRRFFTPKHLSSRPVECIFTQKYPSKSLVEHIFTMKNRLTSLNEKIFTSNKINKLKNRHFIS